MWLSTANRTAGSPGRPTHLAVHLLADDQHDLAELFGGETGDDVDKLSRVEWEPGPAGVPLLARVRQPLRGPGRRGASTRAATTSASSSTRSRSSTGRRPTPLRLREATDIDPGHPA